MKKNNMLRIASVLLVAVLLSTCAISGAFAKYTTKGTAETDMARAAIFGVEVTAVGSMFSDVYASDTAYVGNTVVATPNLVVAPGTSGNLAAISVTGTPEVAVEIAYEATLDLGDGWVDAGGNYYCPLVITVGDTEIKTGATIDAITVTDAGTFESAVAAAVAKLTKQYAPNTNLAVALNGVEANPGEGIEAVAPDLAISWAWAFEGAGIDDEKDTFLGEQGLPTIDFSVTATVTQID